MNELGQHIRQVRTEKGWTQAQLADQLYVSRQTISNWENGRSIPDYEMLGRLTKLLQLDTGITLPEAHQQQEEAAQTEQPSSEEAEPVKKTNRSPWLLWAMVGIVLLLGMLIVAYRLFPSNQSPYTIEWFMQTQTPQAGTTFVRTYSLESPVKARRNRPEATPIYQFPLFMKEENGVGCTIQEIVLVYFKDTKVLYVDSLTQQEFEDNFLSSPYIGAHEYRRMGYSRFAGKETGMGFWIRGMDDNGNPFESRYYLPLLNE